MTQAGASLILFLTTSTITVLSWFIFFPNMPYVTRINTNPPILRKSLSILLLIHTLFIIYQLSILTPPNLFTRLHLSLGIPTDAIRSLLLVNTDDTELPRPIETLLKRLGSFEMRTLYVRFGHDALATCEYCSSYGDFALYALPQPLLAYLREATLIGLLTIKGTRLERYRTLGIGTLVAAAAGECYWISSVSITIPKATEPNPTMWHDTSTLLRRALFLLLPIVIHFFLRPSPPPLTQETLNAAAQGIPSPQLPPAVIHTHALLTKLQLLRFTRGVIQRRPELRQKAGEWWETERQEGTWVREDEGVEKMARDMKMGYENSEGRNSDEGIGPLRSMARNGVNALLRGFVPSSLWQPPQPPR